MGRGYGNGRSLRYAKGKPHPTSGAAQKELIDFDATHGKRTIDLDECPPSVAVESPTALTAKFAAQTGGQHMPLKVATRTRTSSGAYSVLGQRVLPISKTAT